MRDINAELNKFSAVVKCVDCDDHIPNHQVLIQRHYMEKHRIDNHVLKREKAWNFKESRIVSDPLRTVF